MKELTLKETLMLSPIEKHILYNKFPSGLFFNIILVVLVTIQVTFLFSFTAAFPRETERVFRYILLGNADDEFRVLKMNSPLDVQTQLLRVQDVFMNMDNYLFQNIDTSTAQFGINAYYKYPIESKETYTIDITKGFTTPFDANDVSSIKSFFERILEMEITIHNLTTYNYIDQTQKDLCLNWTVSMLYDLSQFTQTTTTVTSQSQLCDAGVVVGSDASVGVSFIVLAIALISLIRMITKFFKIGKIFIEIKSAYINYVNHNQTKDMDNLEIQKQELIEAAGENIEEKIEDYIRYQSWEDVPFSAKMSLFSGWFIFNAIGNIFQVVSSMLLVVAFFSPITAQGFYIAQVTLGLSIFCSWVQLLQYLGFWKDLTLMTSALRKAMVPLIVFFSICIPIFLGIALLGYSLFWKYDKFSSVGTAMVSLYSLACGDIVHESFADTWNEGLVSMIFIIIFVILYYTAFTNIFVAIIMEGFLKAEIRKKIDNDDPFPSQENLLVYRKTSLEIPGRSREDRRPKSNPKFMKTLSRELGNPRLSNNAKSITYTINLLLYQHEEVKQELEDLIKIQEVIEKRNYDSRTKEFLENLLKTHVAKIIKKISYYELIFKKSLESRNLDESAS